MANLKQLVGAVHDHDRARLEQLLAGEFTLNGAAGALEAAAALLSIEHRLIPPTANTDAPDDDMEIDLVVGGARPWTPGPSISNNFGFGGHNGSVVIAPVA